MPDELMRFKFGEAIFIGTRMNPIRAKIIPIFEYPFKIKKSLLPNKSKKYNIECFNLDEFRKNKEIKNMNKIELE